MILDKFSLQGKVSLITGSSRGIGQALATALAEAGSDLIISARNKKRLERVKITINKSTGRKVVDIVADLARDKDIARLVKESKKEFGKIDVLVNTAGINLRGLSEDFSIKDWDQVMKVNLRSVFLLSQQVAKIMIHQGGGRIINIASLGSEIARPTIAAYTASKGGIRQLTKALAVEWAKYNINVNAIGPGYISTNLTEPLRKDKKLNKWVMDRLAIKRWGEPADLMGVVVFLASEASSYITGQILYVDGGWLAG